MAVSAEAWQYLPRPGMLFYVLSRLGSICQGLACYYISCHALAVSAEAWHAFLYLVTPWQYLLRLGILLYILSHLGSICRGLSCFSNILSRLGSICRGLACFSILSRLGSICLGLAVHSVSYHALAVSAKGSTSKNPSYKSSSWNLKNNSGLQSVSGTCWSPYLEHPDCHIMIMFVCIWIHIWIHILSIHIHEFIHEFIYSSYIFIKNVFIHEFISEFTCMNMN